MTSITPSVLKDGHTIQILVNCAGIQRRHPSHEFPDSDWNEVYVASIDLTGAYSDLRTGDTSQSQLSVQSVP